MRLPIRIVDGPLAERVISVDGTWPQPGLNLSHWPGNTTPVELKRDLSTGIALAFARLSPARREELARGCTALANNHYDTDGVCALFAVREPEAALAREGILLETAAAGDLFRFPSERAFAIDCVIQGLVDPDLSPWRARFVGLGDRERRELATNEAVRILPELLDGALEPFADLWRAKSEACLADRRDLALAARDELVHLDLAVWTAPSGRISSRVGATAFDPGRHALFGGTDADRVLVIGPGARGTTYRFLINTTSWFDLVTRRAAARPDLARLAARLDELESAEKGAAGSAGVHDSPAGPAWRWQDEHTPSPELWFGGREHALFAEHAPALAASCLDPVRVRGEIVEALRAAWVFPDES